MLAVLAMRIDARKEERGERFGGISYLEREHIRYPKRSMVRKEICSGVGRPFKNKLLRLPDGSTGLFSSIGGVLHFGASPNSQY